MKRITILLSVFALVAGLSQCRKPSFSALNGGETQHVVLNASWDNGGSKIDQDGVNLKWTSGDKVTVWQGETSIGTLECKDVTDGIFEGYIMKTTGNITFTFGSNDYKDAEDFMNQTGTSLNGAVYLTSGACEYKEDGNYGEVPMTMPHAVLKLDLSALGTADGTTVTIKADGTDVASVSGVKNDSENVYVAFPVEKSRDAKIYEFVSIVGSASCKGWELKENTFYTLKNGDGAAIVVTPSSPELLPGKFSVSADKYVQFSRGNLQATYDGSGYTFGFAANQYDYIGGRDKNGVGTVTGNNTINEQTVGAVVDLFGWSTPTTDYGINISTNNGSYSGNFKDWGGLAIGGYEANTWHTLSRAEWDYLLRDRDDATNLRKWVTLTDVSVSGFVFLPDGTNPSVKDLITTTSDLATYNAVFLPAAGKREGTGLIDVGVEGFYWPSTPNGDVAYGLYFCSTSMGTDPSDRYFGYSVRLVQRFEKPDVEPGKFSVSATDKISFAPGNLYYNGADDDHKMNSALSSGWNFYGHQWDCYPSGTSTVTASMEINLFTWGCGDWSTDYNTTTYQTGSDVTMTDWGNLAIGSEPAGTWRTLSSAEWVWLLGPNESPIPGSNCRTSSTINGTDNARYAEVKVNDVGGVMVFPDVFAWPSDVAYKPSTFNTFSPDWNGVSYNAADFGRLESAGVVFLPVAGCRNGTSLSNVGSRGYYWSSTCSSSLKAYYLGFRSDIFNPQSDYYERKQGHSVRLVR